MPYGAGEDSGLRILVTNHHLEVRAGSELVSLEVAEELQRRGRTVALFTHQCGDLARDFTSRTGIPVFTPSDRDSIRAWNPDLLHVHHWPTLAYLRSLGLGAPAVIGFLGVLPDLEKPPPGDAASSIPWWGVSEEVTTTVSLDQRWADSPHTIIRNWFDDGPPRRAVPPEPGLESVLVVSNHFPPDLLAQLRREFGRSGVEVVHVGLPTNPQEVDRGLLLEHDAVVSLGRTAIQAMALGIPVLVLDQNGGDGWVTASSVDTLARCNFSGRAHRLPATDASVRGWCDAVPSRDDLLAVQDWTWTNCRLSVAVDHLVGLHDLALRSGQDHPARGWERVVGEYVQRATDLTSLVRTLQADQGPLREELETLRSEAAAARERINTTAQALAEARAQRDDLQRALDEVLVSRSWRVTAPLRALMRRRRGAQTPAANSNPQETAPRSMAAPSQNEQNVGAEPASAYDSSRLDVHSRAAQFEFLREERRLPALQQPRGSREPQIRTSRSIPVLAWLGHLDSEGWAFTLGAGVEQLDSGFFEGVWNGGFTGSSPLEAEYVFGSGMAMDDDAPRFIPPSHPKEALYVVGDERNGNSWVSNSLAFALLAADVDPESAFFRAVTTRLRDHTIEDNERGIDRARPLVAAHDGLVLQRVVFHAFEVGAAGTLRRFWRSPHQGFSGYAEYRALLRQVLAGIVANGQDPARTRPLRPVTGVSKGYDSVAVSALVAELGVTEAMTLDVEVYGRDDSGRDVAEALGLSVTTHPHVMSGSIGDLNLDALPADWWEPALEFLATHGLGDDVNHLGFEDRLRQALFFSGTWGDTIWPRQRNSKSGLTAGPWGGSLGEFRLRVGFAWVPVPFIGARFVPPVHAITESGEMQPYTLGTDYDRPIPRRIAEDSGVPRHLFGQAKTATAPFIAAHREYLSTAITAMWERYSGWEV